MKQPTECSPLLQVIPTSTKTQCNRKSVNWLSPYLFFSTHDHFCWHEVGSEESSREKVYKDNPFEDIEGLDHYLEILIVLKAVDLLIKDEANFQRSLEDHHKKTWHLVVQQPGSVYYIVLVWNATLHGP